MVRICDMTEHDNGTTYEWRAKLASVVKHRPQMMEHEPQREKNLPKTEDIFIIVHRHSVVLLKSAWL